MKILQVIQRKIVQKRVKDISDEYTIMISSLVKGWLDTGNLLCFRHCLDNIPSGSSVVEIGSFQGLSTIMLDYYSKGRHIIFNCDTWAPAPGIIDSCHSEIKIDPSTHKDFIKSSYINNISYFCNTLPHSFEMSSDEFFNKWTEGAACKDVFGNMARLGGGIGFCFIDGEHSYEQTKKDFINTDRNLIRGGFVLFDDSPDYSDLGCYRFVKWMLGNVAYRFVMKNPNYLFQKL
jgi:hypothetical protein